MEKNKDKQIADLEETLGEVLIALKHTLENASFPQGRQGQMTNMEMWTVYEQTKASYPNVKKYINDYIK